MQVVGTYFMQKIPKYCMDILFLKEMTHNSYSWSVGSLHNRYLAKNTVWEGTRVKFMEKFEKHLGLVLKVNISPEESGWEYTLVILWLMKRNMYLVFDWFPALELLKSLGMYLDKSSKGVSCYVNEVVLEKPSGYLRRGSGCQGNQSSD